MNGCEKIQTRLSDYVVGGCAEREHQVISSHLQTCSACKKELAALQKTATLLGTIPEEDPPADLWLSVRAEIEKPVEIYTRANLLDLLRGWRLPRLAWAGLAVTAIAVAILWWPTSAPRTATTQLPEENFIEQHGMLAWNDPLTDKAALGLSVGLSVIGKGTE